MIQPVGPGIQGLVEKPVPEKAVVRVVVEDDRPRPVRVVEGAVAVVPGTPLVVVQFVAEVADRLAVRLVLAGLAVGRGVGGARLLALGVGGPAGLLLLGAGRRRV